MLSLGYVVNAFAAYWLFGEALGAGALRRHRPHPRRRLRRGAQLRRLAHVRRHFLPFARPVIDADDHRRRRRRAALGLDHRRPEDARVRGARCRRSSAAVRCARSPTARRRWKSRCASPASAPATRSSPRRSPGSRPPTSIVAVGATPVFVDIDPRTRNIDLDAVEAAITPRTRAIMPVYLSGLPVDMDRLYAIAQAHGLRVIEDAAQAIGSRWNGTRIGSFGDLVTFSFQANKNITSAEGGCLVLNNEAEAERAERLRLQGVVRSRRRRHGRRRARRQVQPDRHQRRASACGQLRAPRRVHRAAPQLARALFRLRRALGLAALGIELPQPLASIGANSNWHMFQVLLPAERLRGGRAAFMEAMRSAASARACTTRPCTCSRCTAGSAARRHVPARRAHRPRASSRCRSFRRCTTATSNASATRLARATCRRLLVVSSPDLSIVIPVYNEEAGCRAVRAPVSGARRAGRAVRDHLRQRRQPRPFGAAARRAVPRAPRRDARGPVQRQLRPAHGDPRRLRAVARRDRDHARRRPAESAGGDRQAGRDDARRLRLRRHHPAQRQDSAFRAHRLARDEPAARAHHAHPDDRPGLHAARLRPRTSIDAINACREVNTFIPALAYTFARNPTEIEVAHEERCAGESKYSLYRLIRLNFDLVTGFSLVPLQWSSRCIGIAPVALLGALFVLLLVRRFLFGAEVEGVFTLFAHHVLPDRRDPVRHRAARRIHRPHLPAGARAGRAT